MFETPSKIISSVMVGLGIPEKELLDEHEIARIVFRKLAYYYEGIRQSDQNLMTSVTSEFTLATGANTKDLTALATDIITPLWCERKIHDATNDYWEFVPTVNLDSLVERRARYEAAVSFYGSNANQITAAFSLYGDESGSPYSTYRIWYSPANSFTNNKDATLAIPDTVTALVAVDAQLNCIPQLIVNASKYLDKRPDLAARISAWQGMAGALQVEKAEWTKHFETWSRRSRGAHRAINHSEVLSGGGY